MELDTCRTCLERKASVSLFLKEEDDIQYSSKIMRCVGVEITEDDHLPKMICVDCVSELRTAFRFVQRCESADRTLRSLPVSELTSFDDYSPPNNVKDDPDDFYADELIKDEPDDVFDEQFLSDFKIDEKNPIVEKNVSCIEVEKKYKPVKKKKKKRREKMGPIQCVVCGLLAPCRSAMENHMRCHTGEKPFHCSVCNMKFSTKGGMKRHEQNNHKERERRFTCEMCGNSFFTKADIITHMRIHTNEKPYQCTECSTAFRQIASLIRHKRIHSGEKPYACPVCGKCFADRNLVKKHQLVHSDERKFTCDLCSKSVKTRTALRTHLRLHSNEKNNVCSFCGTAFAMKGNLRTHMRRMHSEKSGHCTVCARTFADLQQHMRKHTGEKPFGCRACGQTYSTKRSLTHHIAFKHENVSKFKCSIEDCTRSFPTAVMLEFHLLKHSNHTPFICPHCARGFYRNSDLSRHLKISHLEVQNRMIIKTMPQ